MNLEEALRQAANDEPLDQALAGLHAIADTLGVTAATYEARNVTEVCDLLVSAIRRLQERARVEEVR